ncbi:excalibur calcium-binding domain-containing protein [Micromonosporaceae bacterium Da 78-11]
MFKNVTRAVLILALVGGGTAVTTVPAQAAAKHYQNCTALHQKYKHGVAKKGAKDKVRGHTKPVTTFTVNAALYQANVKLDRDKDGVACEKR